jgi:hypothetical protein
MHEEEEKLLTVKRERAIDFLLQVGKPTQSGRSELEVRRGGFACQGVPAIGTDRDGRKNFFWRNANQQVLEVQQVSYSPLEKRVYV